VRRLAYSVLAYIREHRLLRPGDRVGIAVSGGADSVALVRLMLELRDELGIVLSLVHLNHKLRGAASDADEEFVRELAERHGLEIGAESCDVKALATETKRGLEAAAREARYQFFERALESSVNRIATAHTQDDQAETVLLKLARGAWTRGLAGIFPEVVVAQRSLPMGENTPGVEQRAFSTSNLRYRSAAVGKGETDLSPGAGSVRTIIRPLLGTRRSQLRAYLAELDQDWREDATNRDPGHTRNRIRHQVLPLVKSEVNPSVSEVLAETAEIARAEEEYWAGEIRRLLPAVWSRDPSQGSCGGILKQNLVASYPLAVQRRLLRAAAESLGLRLDFHHIEGALGLKSEGECFMLPGDRIVQLRGDELRFRQSVEPLLDYEYPLPVPGRIGVAEINLEVETKLVDGTVANELYDPRDLIDFEVARHGLVLRNWRSGERFWPAHTKQPANIKELLQSRHITGERKKLWPIVSSGEEVIWMKGFGVRRDFQPRTQQAILIQEVKKSR